MSRVSGIRMRACGIGVVVVALAVPLVAGQAAKTPPVPAGGFTPFRGPGLRETTVGAMALVQADCPLQLDVTTVRRSDRGVIVGLRIGNSSDGAIERHLLRAWVVAVDGTIRGRQQVPGRRTIDAGEIAPVEFTFRNAPVQTSDVIVVAVEDADGSRPWHRESKLLDGDLKEALRGSR